MYRQPHSSHWVTSHHTVLELDQLKSLTIQYWRAVKVSIQHDKIESSTISASLLVAWTCVSSWIRGSIPLTKVWGQSKGSLCPQWHCQVAKSVLFALKPYCCHLLCVIPDWLGSCLFKIFFTNSAQAGADSSKQVWENIQRTGSKVFVFHTPFHTNPWNCCFKSWVSKLQPKATTRLAHSNLFFWSELLLMFVSFTH